MTAGGPAPAPELELGRKRRGKSSSSSSSTTQDLLLGVAGGLPAAFAELVEQLLVEGEEGAAVSVAVAALTRLRSSGGAARSRACAGAATEEPLPGDLVRELLEEWGFAAERWRDWEVDPQPTNQACVTSHGFPSHPGQLRGMTARRTDLPAPGWSSV